MLVIRAKGMMTHRLRYSDGLVHTERDVVHATHDGDTRTRVRNEDVEEAARSQMSSARATMLFGRRSVVDCPLFGRRGVA